jgi:hypothetical protein
MSFSLIGLRDYECDYGGGEEEEGRREKNPQLQKNDLTRHTALQQKWLLLES